MRYLSARHVLSLAKVVEAVEAGRHVRWLAGSGDVLEGTLRGFVTHEGTMTSSTCPDMRDSWIRITSTFGSDFWLETEEAAGLYEEGALSLG